MSNENGMYKPKDIVWVKLSGCWWPGEVQNNEELPDEVKEDVDEDCVAVVKFFDEDYYEPVYSEKDIHPYDCPEKQEFMEKGMARYRSKMKDGSSVLKKLPDDLKKAQEITGGPTDIIDQLMTAPKSSKISYDEIFSPSGTKRKGPAQPTPKSAKKARGGGDTTPLIAHVASSVEKPKAATPKAKPTSGKKAVTKTPDVTPSSGFQCEFCSFNTNRLNLIILHRKSHTDGVLPIEKKPEVKETPKKRTKANKADSQPQRDSAFDSLVGTSSQSAELTKKRVRKNESPQRASSQPSTPQKKKKASPTKTTSLLAEFSKKKPSPMKKLVQDPAKSAEIKSKLLADWDDDEIAAPLPEKEKSDDENDVTENVLLSTRSDDEDDDEAREAEAKKLESQVNDLLESTVVPEIPAVNEEGDRTSPSGPGPKIIAATETEPATHPTESILDTSHLQPVHKTIPVPADFTACSETTTVTSISTIASTQEGTSEAVIQQELAVPAPPLVLSPAVVLQDGQIVAQAPTDINGETYVFVALDDADTANLNGATFVAYADSQDTSEQTFFVQSESLNQNIGGTVLGVQPTANGVEKE